MNRLVIIGNGFDLAHGLPTGYCDFIDWYWRNHKIKKTASEESNIIVHTYDSDLYTLRIHFKRIIPTDDMNRIINEMDSIESYPEIISFKNRYSKGVIFEYKRYVENCIFLFKNTFFELICQKDHIQNWVDIENEYFQLLKVCLKDSNNEKVKLLNSEFEEVKRLLEQYLTEEIEDKYKLEINIDTMKILAQVKYLDNDESYRLFEEFQSFEARNCETMLNRDAPIFGPAFQINQVRYLNFNYTSLLNKTISFLNNEEIYKEIQIHGKLNDSNNKINFGFGDEMDDEYKAIEKKDDNEYLRNIKSFAYLNTPNYKETIDFLELDKFQVYIMGHSCGLSDRILLNKVFEHKNCCSIKIYYHQNGDKDNYTDIAQNISRHFNKKEMMRERIVNKTLCEPLPQTQLSLK